MSFTLGCVYAAGAGVELAVMKPIHNICFWKEYGVFPEMEDPSCPIIVSTGTAKKELLLVGIHHQVRSKDTWHLYDTSKAI